MKSLSSLAPQRSCLASSSERVQGPRRLLRLLRRSRRKRRLAESRCPGRPRRSSQARRRGQAARGGREARDARHVGARSRPAAGRRVLSRRRPPAGDQAARPIGVHSRHAARGIDRAPRSHSSPRTVLLPDRAVSRGHSASRRDSCLGTGQPRIGYILGLAYIQGRQPDAARTSLARTFRLPPDSAGAHVIAAQMMLRLEMEPQAEAELKRAIEKDPRTPRANYLLGQTALFRGRFDEVIALTEARAGGEPE